MTRLVDEGWVAPADPGPTRRVAVMALAVAVASMAAWAVLASGAIDSLRLDGDETYEVRVRDDGRADVRLTKSELTQGRARVQQLDSEVRTSGDTRLLVVHGPIDGAGHADVDIDLDIPASVERDLVATRFQPPTVGSDRGYVMVTIPASQMLDVPAMRPTGSLRELTRPLDARISDAAADRRLRRRLHDGWWWIAPLGVLFAVGLPLWLWRHERRRVFSMRVPGPGTKGGSAPPSSLDPVGAAVLVAGARPVDAAGAFAGHVLDLVERRQLRMKRNTDPETGRIGAQLGLAHADEEAVPDDAAVAALRRVVRDDEVTVDVPDDLRAVPQLPRDSREAWRDHVAARARFERMASRYPASRVAAACAASAAFALAGGAGALLADYPGARDAGWLVVALAVPAAVVLGTWAHDARRWRVVARERRTERAQWVAWRSAIGTTDGPALDPRNLPVVAATGPVDGLVRDRAGRDAVALDAVTVRTVASLRAMIDPGA